MSLIDKLFAKSTQSEARQKEKCRHKIEKDKEQVAAAQEALTMLQRKAEKAQISPTEWHKLRMLEKKIEDFLKKPVKRSNVNVKLANILLPVGSITFVLFLVISVVVLEVYQKKRLKKPPED